jgi:TolA-binding protein
MPIDSGDIERLKAAIPKDFQPPPTFRGRLTSYFLSLDSRGASNLIPGSDINARDRLNLEMKFVGSDDSQAPSFILSGAAATLAKRQIDKRNEDHRREERTAFARMMDALNARIDALQDELRDLNLRIAEIERRRADIGATFEALDEIKRRRARNEKLDPANEADRHLLEAAGLSETEANGDDYAATIAAHRRALDTEDGNLSTEWNSKMRRRGDVMNDLADAQAARNDLQTGDTEEARILAERRAETILGRRQLATATFETTGTSAKLVAADAVAGAEVTQRQTASQTLNRDAATQGPNEFFSSQGSDFELDDRAPANKPVALRPG